MNRHTGQGQNVPCCQRTPIINLNRLLMKPRYPIGWTLKPVYGGALTGWPHAPAQPTARREASRQGSLTIL